MEMVKPAGTGRPTAVMSARPAPLPPRISLRSFSSGSDAHALGLTITEKENCFRGFASRLGGLGSLFRNRCGHLLIS